MSSETTRDTAKSHVKRFDVDRAKSKGIVACERLEMPINKLPIEGRIEADKNGFCTIGHFVNPERELLHRDTGSLSGLFKLGQLLQILSPKHFVFLASICQPSYAQRKQGLIAPFNLHPPSIETLQGQRRQREMVSSRAVTITRCLLPRA